jgi:hypothetical protein
MPPVFCRRSYGSLRHRGAMLLCCAVLSAGGSSRLSAQQPPMVVTPVEGCSPACQELRASRGKLSSASPGAVQLSAPALLPAVSGLSHAAALGTHSEFPGDPAQSPPVLGGPVPDIVWQRDASGDASLWHMIGASWRGGFTPLPAAPSAWRIAAAADFTGNGLADLVWQNVITGERSIWLMDGAEWPGGFVMLPQVDTSWVIVAAADFDGDGDPDLVWQRPSTGQTSIWNMNGTTWTGGFSELQAVSPAWRIGAVADFNDDGVPDLVWQNVLTGERSIWLMQGMTWGGTFVSLPAVDTAWSIVGAGTFSGATPDLVWQNLASGERAIWYMNGTSYSGAYAILPTVDPAWRIAAAARLLPADRLAPRMDVAAVQSTAALRPELCLTIAVDPASSYECGHLRVAHELPAVRSMSRTRAPVLTHHSQHAAPRPLIAFDLRIPTGGLTPDSVVADLSVAGTHRASGRWSPASIVADSMRRAAVGFDAMTDGTGVYPYTLVVTAWYGSHTPGRY